MLVVGLEERPPERCTPHTPHPLNYQHTATIFGAAHPTPLLFLVPLRCTCTNSVNIPQQELEVTPKRDSEACNQRDKPGGATVVHTSHHHANGLGGQLTVFGFPVLSIHSCGKCWFTCGRSRSLCKRAWDAACDVDAESRSIRRRRSHTHFTLALTHSP